jgi:hypothetical protein
VKTAFTRIRAIGNAFSRSPLVVKTPGNNTIPEGIIRLFEHESLEELLKKYNELNQDTQNVDGIRSLSDKGYLKLRYLIGWYLANREYADPQLSE